MTMPVSDRPVFSDLVYSRPDEKTFLYLINQTAEQIRNAVQVQEITDAVTAFERERLNLKDLINLARIRSAAGSRKAFYAGELKYLLKLETMMLQGFETVAEALLVHRLEDEVRERIGDHCLFEARRHITAYSSAIMPEIEEEKRLVARLDNLLGPAGWHHPEALSFVWDEAEQMLSAEERRSNLHADVGLFNQSLKVRATLVTDLISIRDRSARKRGYRHYVEFARHRSRLDSSLHRDKTPFREYVEAYFVPLGEEIRKLQARRLELTTLTTADLYTLIPDAWPEPDKESHDLTDAYDALVTAAFGEKAYRVKGLVRDGYVSFSREVIEKIGRPSLVLLSAASAFLSAGDEKASTFIPRLMTAVGSAYADLTAFEMDRRLGVSGADRFSRALAGTAAVWLSAPNWHLVLGRAADIALELDLTRRLLEILRLTAIDEFEEQLYLHPEMTVHERNQLWRHLERRYEPTVAAADKSGPFPYGSVWLRHIDFLRRPLTTIEQAMADIVVLAGRPFTYRYGTCKLALILQSYLEGGYTLDAVTRLRQAGLADPFSEETFRRASFAAADLLSL